MEYQQQYWTALTQLRVDIYYLHLYYLSDERTFRRLKVFLAVISTGSIAGWAVWSEFPSVWASIIVLSQIVTAMSPYLPYERRTQAVYELERELSDLAVFCERTWYDVAEGHLSEREIHDLVVEIKDRKNRSQTEKLGRVALPEKTYLLEAAQQKARRYFAHNYGVR